MWRIERTNQAVTKLISPGECIVYGVEPAGYRQREVASSLNVSDAYYVRVNLEVSDPQRHSVLFYDAVFTVCRDQSGALVYPQYNYSPSGETLKPSCEHDKKTRPRAPSAPRQQH
jgi:hypothetical protein